VIAVAASLLAPVCQRCARFLGRKASLARKTGQIVGRGRHRWLVRVFLGRDRETRRRRYLSRTVHGPVRQAQSYLNKVLRERDLGRRVEGVTVPLGEFLDRWLETAAKPKLRDNVTNLAVTQVLEFDVSMYLDGIGMFFGTQCNHLGGGEWDVLDNVTQQWASTGVSCNLTTGWNHLTLQLQRESNNDLLYQSITLNGVTANINKTYAPFTVPASWYGITVNYQMDGDYKQSANKTYLDNLSLTYW
jgi:hypothetical protein